MSNIIRVANASETELPASQCGSDLQFRRSSSSLMRLHLIFISHARSQSPARMHPRRRCEERSICGQ